MDAEMLVPHRPPLCLVGRLLEFSGQTGIVESFIGPDNIFLKEDGTLNSLTLAELIAQASAAVKGYDDLRQGKEIKKGFLVDIREMRFMGECLKGDLLAAGTLKLWVPEDSEIQGATREA
jgi:predicted hotdog family 3-hydroxylacyl-ACP dehydratase